MIDERLKDIFCKLFGEKYRSELCLDTTMDDISEWDSLSFISVIITLEKSFDVKVGPNDALKMVKLSAIQEYLGEQGALE